jgi:hypothetical protein
MIFSLRSLVNSSFHNTPTGGCAPRRRRTGRPGCRSSHGTPPCPAGRQVRTPRLLRGRPHPTASSTPSPHPPSRPWPTRATKAPAPRSACRSTAFAYPAREVNSAHAEVRAIGERAISTLKTWRLPTKPRRCPQLATALVAAILTLHLHAASWKGINVGNGYKSQLVGSRSELFRQATTWAKYRCGGDRAAIDLD